MNALEEEVILLRAAVEAIDSMVNRALFDVSGEDHDGSITFHTSIHQQLFNIRLTDFLSRTDKRAVIQQTSYLGGLRRIAEQPGFEPPGAVASLRKATQSFVEWLEQKVEVDIWMPSIDQEVRLIIARIQFLKMCGDISKHNFLRAIGVAEDLREILAGSGVAVTIEEAVLAFEDFYGRFHTDILNYHASTIAEYLNNIRWGIHDYLRPEFERSIVWHEGAPPRMYHYTYPPYLQSSFSKACYWDLMNDVRSEPYVQPFTVTKYLKLRY